MGIMSYLYVMFNDRPGVDDDAIFDPAIGIQYCCGHYHTAFTDLGASRYDGARMH